MRGADDLAVARLFEATYGAAPDAAASAPGRVNLIGEHVDYTGGTVLPTVIPARVRVALGKAGEGVTIRSTRWDEPVTRGADDALTGHWSDYVLAGHQEAVALGLLPENAAYLIDGDVPDGAGVSSSAALLIAVLRAATIAAGGEVVPETLARWAQRVETERIGVPCGIMDQMAVAAGRPGHAMALDTRTLAYEEVALPTGYAFPVFHSGVRRALSDGGYAARRASCEAATRALGLASLTALSPLGEGALPRLDALPDEDRRRARHAITEHARVLRAVPALRAGDAETFGRLMNESHASMRDDFEIVPPVMDEMAMTAQRLGALSARLTGGGFGGCLVACVPAAGAARWWSGMASAYPQASLVTLGLPQGSLKGSPQERGRRA